MSATGTQRLGIGAKLSSQLNVLIRSSDRKEAPSFARSEYSCIN